MKNKLNITLIYPRVSDSPFPPLGILTIASILRKDNNVQVIDAFLGSKEYLSEINNPDVIGLSILTTQYNRAKEMIKMLKRRFPKAFFVVGGVHPTALPKQSLNDLKVDCIVVGEGDITFKELCKQIRNKEDIGKVKGLMYKKGKKIVFTGLRELIADLDTIPFPSRDLLKNFDWYLSPPGRIRGEFLKSSTTIMVSRGCPYRCIYCGSKLIFGRKVRYRSVGNVIKEIKQLIMDYDLEGLWFLDDTFIVNKDWVEELCKHMIKEKIKLKWGVQARVNLVDEELLRIMKRAGCVQLDFGVESGSPKVLKALKKDTNPEMIKRAFKIAKKVGLRRMASFMLGNPEETEEDIMMTFKLAKEISPDFALFFFTTPFPGTELYDMAEKNKWITDPNYSKWDVRHSESSVMQINLTEEQLKKYKSKFQNYFFIRNYLLYLKNPLMVLRVIGIMLRYPKELLKGFRRFLRTKRIDDLIELALHKWRMSLKKE